MFWQFKNFGWPVTQNCGKAKWRQFSKVFWPSPTNQPVTRRLKAELGRLLPSTRQYLSRNFSFRDNDEINCHVSGFTMFPYLLFQVFRGKGCRKATPFELWIEIYGWEGGWVDWWIGGWMEGWMDGWNLVGWTVTVAPSSGVYTATLLSCIVPRDSQPLWRKIITRLRRIKHRGAISGWIGMGWMSGRG